MSLRDDIANQAIKWADEKVLEWSKNERKGESAFVHRVNQQTALQNISRLVAELHQMGDGDDDAGD